MLIEIYSDVICPWCFIGKQRLDAVLATDVGDDIELAWRPYQLYPNLPAGGIDRGEFLRAQYGDRADRTKTPSQIRVDAEQVGIVFDYAAIERVPDTLAAHRLLRYAEVEETPQGSQHALAERLFRMYFCEGRDVGRIDVLVEAAGDVGLQMEAVRGYLESESGTAQTLADIQEGMGLGVAGVPCYRLGKMFMLPGAQLADTMVQFIERAKSRLAAS